MYQAAERPRTPTRFQAVITTKNPIEISPYKQGRPNNRYANPSMTSNDVFYEKHYENPDKQMTPKEVPLHIPPKGYGRLIDYRDRYKEISGHRGSGRSATPTASRGGYQNSIRSGKDHNIQESDLRSGNRTPQRYQPRTPPGGPNPNAHIQATGSRTPTRRSFIQEDLRKVTGIRPATPSGTRTPNRGYNEQGGSRRAQTPTPCRSAVSESTTLTNAELICDNCINQNMIEEKRAQKQRLKDAEEKYQNEVLQREKAERLRELEDAQHKKERFRQEAIEHWEETKRIKALQKEEDKKNNEAQRDIFHDRILSEEQERDLARKRRNQLRNDLKKQIQEKRFLDEKSKEEAQQVPNSGLPIGVDNFNRYDRYRDAHKLALKEQIEEKAKLKEQEKEHDKRLQEEYAKDVEDFNRKEAERKVEADRLKKEHYRSEMERYQLEKENKKRLAEAERARDQELNALNKAREQEAENIKVEALRQREEAHLAALRDQMDDAAIKKKEEEAERKKYKIPVFQAEKPKKLYNCTECHHKFPPSQLNKIKDNHGEVEYEPDFNY